MLKSFFGAKKWALWSWGGAVLIVLGLLAQTHLSVLINSWYRDFYDLLQLAPTPQNTSGAHSTYEQFLASFARFCIIAFIYVLIASFMAWFARMFAFAWREAMSFEYLRRWREVDGYIEGSSQRIQEDIYRFARIIEGLGMSVFRAIMTLVAFLPILYEVGKGVSVPVFSGDFALMIWAVIASIGGLVISWIVGMRLPHLEYNNQKIEARFRKELVYAEEDRANHASVESIAEIFTGLRLNYRRLFLHYGYFDLWLYTYEQFMVIFAYLLVGGNLFTGVMTLGALTQINDAFSRVRSSFSVLTSNWTTITELRSIYKRLKEFEQHINYQSK